MLCIGKTQFGKLHRSDITLEKSFLASMFFLKCELSEITTGASGGLTHGKVSVPCPRGRTNLALNYVRESRLIDENKFRSLPAALITLSYDIVP